MTALPPPDGFIPHFKKSPFTDPFEPLYSRIDPAQISIGTWLREAHCNSRGLVHGGFVATLADNAMGLTCVSALKAEGREVTSLVTISLNVDYVGMAKIGDWIDTESTAIRLTKSLGFINGLIKANDRVIARATATFKIR
jgi:uncharacterized protein (TIGR00369 family)